MSYIGKFWNKQKGMSTTVHRTRNGGLLFDHYDFSDEAESCLGGEVAYQLTLTPASIFRLKEVLNLPGDVTEGAFLKAVEDRCSSFYGFKSYLKENSIPANVQRDPWP